MQKILFTLIAILSLHGCVSSSESYYVLSMPSQPSTVYSTKVRMIGVEKISIPGYLYKREIAVATSSNQITLLGNAVWGEDLDSGLTQRLISYLQKKFNHPHVYAYPWGVGKQPNIKVSVNINRFIAQGNKVYLDASYEIENIQTERRKAALFTTSVASSSDINSIVSGMNRAFGQLEEKIAFTIHRF